MKGLIRCAKVIGLSVLIGLLAVPHVAWAHEVELIKSSPNSDETLQNPPQEIILQFSEEMNSKESFVELVDASGATLAKGTVDLNGVEHDTLRAAVPQTLGKGVYTIHYHVLLLDGDTTDKQYRFGMGVAVPRSAVPRSVVNANPQQDISRQQPAINGTSQWIVPTLTALAMIFVVLGVVTFRRMMRARNSLRHPM